MTPIWSETSPQREGRPIGAHLWDSGGQLVSGQTSLHYTVGAVSSLWRPSLVASLHLEGQGNQVLEQMAGPLVHKSGGGGYLVLSRRVARATTTWAHASARRWVRSIKRDMSETWVRSIKIP